MSTYNICFCSEIRKILCGYPLLSVAMGEDFSLTTLMLKGPSDSCDSNLGPFNYYFIQIPSCGAISFQNGRSSPSSNLNFIVHLQIEGRICFKSESCIDKHGSHLGCYQ